MNPLRILIGTRIGVVIALAIFGAWYFEARNIALLADVHGFSRDLGTRTISQIGWNRTYLVIDGQIFGLENSRDTDAMSLTVDGAHRLIATANGKSIMLGVEHGTLMLRGDPEPNPAFHAETGDHITITRMQGRLSWPNWFEANYMTGNSPRWLRFFTYRVTWKKPSGASLQLFWRYEQLYYPMDGWGPGQATGPDSCGLVDVRITPGTK